MSRKKENKEAEAVFAADPSSQGPKRITPLDIQQKVFKLAFRGYAEREVDAFLDQVTEEVARLASENKSLREQVQRAEMRATTPLDPSAAAGADALVRQAREEAGRILEEARAEARAIALAANRDAPVAGAGTVPGVDPGYVTRERGFLQSLAGLIQAHAEAVREDLRHARDGETTGSPEDPYPGEPAERSGEAAGDHAATAAPEGVIGAWPAERQPEPGTGSEAADATRGVALPELAAKMQERRSEATQAVEPGDPGGGGAGGPEAHESGGSRGGVTATSETSATTSSTVPGDRTTVEVVEDDQEGVPAWWETGPAPASARADSEPERPSLRELFWGED